MTQIKSRVHLRGFGSMEPERQRALASKGGIKAHALGTAHRWTSEEARIAGKKGGVASQRKAGRV